MNATMLVEEVGVAVKPVGIPGKGVVNREEIERAVRLVLESEEGNVSYVMNRIKIKGENENKAVGQGEDNVFETGAK
ncbi:anthocyanidin 3-o-glucosyltransferase 5 [Quercus suber]|uniref:Anthocyanidin 3-o-glucosyltransferase 5 n=1 Tax=Quercus suber TaxID=58331 RepID=A0AAW0LCK5_QUESU